MPEPETRYTRAKDGVRIAYQFIEGGDPVFLVVPATGHQFDAIERIPVWRTYRDALRGSNAWLLPDLRGFGLSGDYEPPVSIADLLLDLEAVVAEVPNRDLVLVSYRGGNPVAAEFAIKYSGRVRCLFLDEPTVKVYPPGFLAFLREDPETGWFYGARASYDWNDEGALKEIVRSRVAGLRGENFWDHARAAEEWPLADRLREVPVPLVMHATTWDAEDARELAADLPGAQLEIEPDLIVSERQAHRVRQLLGPHLAQQARSARSGGPSNASAAARLTPRQLEVLRLVAEGLTDPAIGARLHIATGTASRHVSDILRRLDLSNRTEAASYAAEHRLAPPSEDSGD